MYSIILREINDKEYKVGMEIQYKYFKLKNKEEKEAFLYDDSFILSEHLEECSPDDKEAIDPLILFKKKDLIGIKKVFEEFTGMDIRCLDYKYNKSTDDLEYIRNLFAFPKGDYRPNLKYTWMDENSESFKNRKYDFYSKYNF